MNTSLSVKKVVRRTKRIARNADCKTFVVPSSFLENMFEADMLSPGKWQIVQVCSGVQANR